MYDWVLTHNQDVTIIPNTSISTGSSVQAGTLTIDHSRYYRVYYTYVEDSCGELMITFDYIRMALGLPASRPIMCHATIRLSSVTSKQCIVWKRSRSDEWLNQSQLNESQLIELQKVIALRRLTRIGPYNDNSSDQVRHLVRNGHIIGLEYKHYDIVPNYTSHHMSTVNDIIKGRDSSHIMRLMDTMVDSTTQTAVRGLHKNITNMYSSTIINRLTNP